jgi:hypothetical protein
MAVFHFWIPDDVVLVEEDVFGPVIWLDESEPAIVPGRDEAGTHGAEIGSQLSKNVENRVQSCSGRVLYVLGAKLDSGAMN